MRKDVKYFEAGKEKFGLADECVVLMHPFYEGYLANFHNLAHPIQWVLGSYTLCDNSHGNYFKNLDDYLRKFNGDLVLFEEDFTARNTAKILQKYVNQGGMLVIPTNNGSLTPLNCPWDEVFEKLNKGVNYFLVGGYFNSDEFEDGCAGCLYKIMKQKSYKISPVESCLFTWDD